MGLLRLFLALSVIAGHAGSTVFGVNGIGALYAVNFFFIISGFYMAMVLNGKYSKIGNIQFYKSRVFRLFPAYYVGLVLMLLVYFDVVKGFFLSLTPISKMIYIFENAFIVGQDVSYVLCVKDISGLCVNPGSMSINPPAWSLAVELGFYLIAPFILRSKAKTFAFVFAGAVYLYLVNLIEFPFSGAGLVSRANFWTFGYYFYPSSFAFFGGGALAYHLSKSEVEPHYFLSLAALVLLSFAQTAMPFWHLLFFSMAVPALFRYTANNKLDRVIGELSYPVYIVHYPVLILLKKLSGDGVLLPYQLSLGTVVAISSIAIGLCVYYLIERKVSTFRHSEEFLDSAGLKSFSLAFYIPRIAFLVYLVIPVVVMAYVLWAQYSSKLPSQTPYDLTDDNWQGGINRSVAAFFVKSSAANAEVFRVGAKVSVGESGIRQIVRVVGVAPYMNIFVDGDLLDPKRSGYPNKITIIE
ncbi:acyltransferase [Pseudomonas nitroreducens]|uniref:Acyltransferase n=1 Tax=Pseudomonas nitroreducens TaxID=46680 RepID=A0A5R8ZYJ1_PSENT|nr:acyltransferase [Pseudomonas nitroreducens]TLP71330.1 acyltransferase [Pseudomonas nitroreducens]